jgi:hypothetical protein
MALVTRTYQVDDLDGSEEDVSTVQFNLDGTNFEIDLSAANAERLRQKLSKFVTAGTAVTPRKAPAPKRVTTAAAVPVSRDQTQAVRDWARNNGYQVSARGRISKTIQEAFEAAH